MQITRDFPAMSWPPGTKPGWTRNADFLEWLPSGQPRWYARRRRSSPSQLFERLKLSTILSAPFFVQGPCPHRVSRNVVLSRFFLAPALLRVRLDCNEARTRITIGNSVEGWVRGDGGAISGSREQKSRLSARRCALVLLRAL